MTEFLHNNQAIDPGHVYTVSITHLRIRKAWRAAGFFLAIRPVLTQINSTDAMSAYGIRTRTWRLDFWTYSAFDDPAALVRFLTTGPHGELMRHFHGRLGPLQTRQLQLTGNQLPESWHDAAHLLSHPSTPAEHPRFSTNSL
ncbi:hypothetical protein [Mycobacterium sp.]|uniref:hypothetical protein n=1 Tax=Mycobacterium sp. TaxID=1785 RepID=UPI003D09B56F